MAIETPPVRVARDPLLETFGPKPEERVGGPIQADPLLDTGFFRQEPQAPAIVPADPLLINGYQDGEAKPKSAEDEKVPVAAWDWYG